MWDLRTARTSILLIPDLLLPIFRAIHRWDLWWNTYKEKTSASRSGRSESSQAIEPSLHRGIVYFFFWKSPFGVSIVPLLVCNVFARKG